VACFVGVAFLGAAVFLGVSVFFGAGGAVCFLAVILVAGEEEGAVFFGAALVSVFLAGAVDFFDASVFLAPVFLPSLEAALALATSLPPAVFLEVGLATVF